MKRFFEKLAFGLGMFVFSFALIWARDFHFSMKKIVIAGVISVGFTAIAMVVPDR